jgi:hypothetical protein
MTRPWHRSLVVAALCAFAVGRMAGCASPLDPPTGPCIRETVFTRQSRIPGSTQITQSFTTPRTGRLVVTVDWVNPLNIVGTALAQAPCSPTQFQEDACNIILNLFPPPKPLEEATTWLRPGTYDLVIGNFSEVDETASTRVTLSSTGCETP